MILISFKVFLVLTLILQVLTNAMEPVQEGEKLSFPQVNFFRVENNYIKPETKYISILLPSEDSGLTGRVQKTKQTIKENLKSVIVNQNEYIGDLMDEILSYIFKFLDLIDVGKASQVSTHWNTLTQIPELWKYMGIKKYEDYLSEEDLKENQKQKAILHYLSVIVNTKTDLKEIERLMCRYNIGTYVPFFKKYIKSTFIIDLIINCIDCEELVSQGNVDIIDRKINILTRGSPFCYVDGCRDENTHNHGYEINHAAAREFNEHLVEKGDLKAINRKIGWLVNGSYGYEINHAAAREFNEYLIEKGDIKAIERKVEGLTHGSYGYEKNPNAAKEFNDLLVKSGNLEASERKLWGLVDGRYGYEKDPNAAREFNDFLIQIGSLKAVEQKLFGLMHEKYGYEINHAAARELNDFFVEKGDIKAVERKIEGLTHGSYGYEKDPNAAREFNDFFVEKGDIKAVERKIEGLTYGKYGYEINHAAAREFNEYLLENGDLEARERKMWGLLSGKYGYEKDPNAAREFNDSLIENGDAKSIMRKIEECTNGGYSYEKNRDSARSFVEGLVINKNPIARAIGHYFVALDQKYGILQLSNKIDRVKAIEYIKYNNVPY